MAHCGRRHRGRPRSIGGHVTFGWQPEEPGDHRVSKSPRLQSPRSNDHHTRTAAGVTNSVGFAPAQPATGQHHHWYIEYAAEREPERHGQQPVPAIEPRLPRGAVRRSSSVYADSGYTAVDGQVLDEAVDNPHMSTRVVVAFPTADQADAFVTTLPRSGRRAKDKPLPNS